MFLTKAFLRKQWLDDQKFNDLNNKDRMMFQNIEKIQNDFFKCYLINSDFYLHIFQFTPCWDEGHRTIAHRTNGYRIIAHRTIAHRIIGYRTIGHRTIGHRTTDMYPQLQHRLPHDCHHKRVPRLSIHVHRQVHKHRYPLTHVFSIQHKCFNWHIRDSFVVCGHVFWLWGLCWFRLYKIRCIHDK